MEKKFVKYEGRAPMTFDELAIRMGRSLDKAACRKWKQKLRCHAKDSHVYPTRRDIYTIQSEICHSLDYVEQWPIEDGEVYQFSHRKLTDWYVQRFCSANNLTQ